VAKLTDKTRCALLIATKDSPRRRGGGKGDETGVREGPRKDSCRESDRKKGCRSNWKRQIVERIWEHLEGFIKGLIDETWRAGARCKLKKESEERRKKS